ncbi:MAG: hypothetical protein WBG50_17765 [Desulfomonilaceae bacterium]
MQRLPLVPVGPAVAGVALLLLFGGLTPQVFAASPIQLINPAFGIILPCSSVGLAGYARLVDFDRDGCEQDCRERYGLSPYSDEDSPPQVEEQGWGGGGGYQPGYYLYANCIARCNRIYWRQFDRKMRRLEKSQ